MKFSKVDAQAKFEEVKAKVQAVANSVEFKAASGIVCYVGGAVAMFKATTATAVVLGAVGVVAGSVILGDAAAQYAARHFSGIGAEGRVIDGEATRVA